MARFELDRLFGLALTDARFYKQLRDRPHQAVRQFQLTEQETQAVIRIAPTTDSIQELAVRLDSWMTETAERPAPERQPYPITLIDRVGLDRSHRDARYTHSHDKTTRQDDEQELCLKLREPIARS